MEKVHVYIWLYTVSIKATVENKNRLFLSLFHVSTSSRLTPDFGRNVPERLRSRL